MPPPRHDSPPLNYIPFCSDRPLADVLRGLALALLLPVRIAAQQGADARTTNASEEAARLRVVTATVPISLDARLDGPEWAHADSITDFRQREPSAGAPASERTVVKVLRDAEAL